MFADGGDGQEACSADNANEEIRPPSSLPACYCISSTELIESLHHFATERDWNLSPAMIGGGFLNEMEVKGNGPFLYNLSKTK
jgi:hypothetical protein